MGIPLLRPYIGLIYGRCLQFGFLEWPSARGATGEDFQGASGEADGAPCQRPVQGALQCVERIEFWIDDLDTELMMSG